MKWHIGFATAAIVFLSSSAQAADPADMKDLIAGFMARQTQADIDAFKKKFQSFTGRELDGEQLRQLTVMALGAAVDIDMVETGVANSPPLEHVAYHCDNAHCSESWGYAPGNLTKGQSDKITRTNMTDILGNIQLTIYCNQAFPGLTVCLYDVPTPNGTQRFAYSANIKIGPPDKEQNTRVFWTPEKKGQ